MSSTDVRSSERQSTPRAYVRRAEAGASGGSGAAIACAAAAMVRAEGEIDDLWHDAVVGENPLLSQRLVEVSHALRRAACLLDEDVIG